MILVVVAALTLLVAAPGARASVGPDAARLPAATQADGPQLPDPRHDPDAERRQARRILAGDDYQEGGRGRSLIEKVRDWIRDRIPRLSRPGGAKAGDGLSRLLSLLVVGVAGGLAVALIVFVVVRIRRGSRVDGGDDDGDDGGDIEVTPLRSTSEWASEAERLETAGEWRPAMRARYRELVGVLIDRELLADVPGRTPGEHRVELAIAASTAAPPFDAATAMFQASWYGDVVTGGDDLARFRELAGSVVEATRPGRGPLTTVGAADGSGEAIR